MAKLTKKQKALEGKIVAQKLYPVQEALALAKETATAKFDESIDVAVNLGVDARKSDQVVRGSVVLPAGTGKSVRVAVFAQGDKAEAAKAAGVQLSGKGIRSYEKQEYFWNCYQTKKCNNGNEAAKPGTSQHESGRAIDFSSGSISWLQKNAIEFGICATVASENWHYSPKNGKTCYHGSE